MKINFKSILFFSLVLLSLNAFAQTKKTTTKTTPKAATTKTTPAKTTAAAITPKTETKAGAVPQPETKTRLIPASSPLSQLGKIGQRNKTGKGAIPESSFRKGSKYLGGNVNFGSSTSTSFALFGEYGVTDYLSVGGSLSMATSSVMRTMYVGGDVTLHLSNWIHSGSIDPFVGISGGYNSFKDKKMGEERDRTNDPNNGMRLNGNAGINYYVTPRTIFFVSASIGIANGSPLQYGGGVKFGL